MVTPISTSSTSLGKAFPLFNSLLKEGRGSNLDLPQCPATAPVIGTTVSKGRAHSRREHNMSEQEASGGGQEATTDVTAKDQTPITLQDPPKSKLKRQLSIDTAERTDSQRVRKKLYVEDGHSNLDKHLFSDEVDGGPCISGVVSDGGRSTSGVVSDGGRSTSGLGVDGSRSASGISIKVEEHGKHASVVADSAVDRRSTTSASYIMNSTHRHLSESSNRTNYCQERVSLSSSPSKQAGNVVYQAYNVPHRQDSIPYQAPSQSLGESRGYHYRDQPDQGLLSPGNFNLSEICQTSPFISTTPKLQKESSVFIFPEQGTPKKVSPYKLSAEKSSGSKTSQHTATPSRQVQRSYSKTEHQQQEQYVGLPERRQMTRGEEPEPIPGIQYPPYVSPKGFVWPSKVPQSSPRISSTDVRPPYPINHESSSSRAINTYEGYEEDLARLYMLRREHARALKAYTSEVGRPRELGEVIRNDRFKTQRSAEEHSPNEKAIREIREDVHNKYERSISDPLYSPKHYRQILRMASRFSRERLSAYSDEATDDEVLDNEDTRRDSWKHDYRRRLFMKDETYGTHATDRRRVQFDHDTHLVTGKTEIPTEVLDFLHSLNFHPEELENLKDYIRRGGSEAASFPSRMATSHLESQEDHLRPPLPEAEFHRRSPNERHESADFRQRQFLSPQREPQRERQLGDINVRLACSNVKEKGNQSTETGSDAKDCKCVRIENEIRAMAMDAYSKIRRMDEFTETNTNMNDSMKVLKHIKCLCSHGRTVEEIYTGSVVFTLNCPDIDALMDLWNMYKSGTLLRLMTDAFITEEFKRRHGCEDIELKVAVSKEEYLTCKHELETSFQQKFLHQKSPSSFIHTRSRSEPASVAKQANNLASPHAKLGTLSPFRERFRSDSSVELSPRRAFQEINTRDTPTQPHSPSKKYFPDNVFLTDDPPRSPLAPLSPQPSTRKKSFGTRFQLQEQQQQENVEQNPDVNTSASGTLV